MTVLYVGDSHGGVLGPLLETRLGLALDVHAMNGAGTAWGLREVEEAIGTATYEACIVQLGGNALAEADVRATAALLEAAQVPWTWIGPLRTACPPTDAGCATVAARHEQNDALLTRLVPAIGGRYVSLRMLTPDAHRDGVHLTADGYRLLADRLAAELVRRSSPKSGAFLGLLIGLGLGGVAAAWFWPRRPL